MSRRRSRRFFRRSYTHRERRRKLQQTVVCWLVGSIIAAVCVGQVAGWMNSLTVAHPPRITAAQIDAVLAQYASPATGQGQAMYDLGVAYRIDPAICLAFFIQESSAGANRNWVGWKADGSTSHNVGNIRCTGDEPCYQGYRDYATWSAGMEDWYRLISDLYVTQEHRTTVEDIIPRYAPAADQNDEAAYIQTIHTLIEQWQTP